MPRPDLTEVDLAKEAFLGILSHELRTPINVIMGYTSLVADGMAGPITSEQREYLGRVLEGADGLLTLVNDMLDMSRIEAGRLTVSLLAVDLGWVCEAAVRGISQAALAKRHTLMMELPEVLPAVLGDEERLHQLLRILLSNAVKFTPEGGTITLRVRPAADHVRIEVSDTGVGITLADQVRLFQRFAQLDQSATRSQGGAGLGLALAKHLIEAHGGEIGVKSEPGRGSTFWLTLRLA